MIFIKPIRLSNSHDYAIVDAAKFQELNQYKWRMDYGYVCRQVREGGKRRWIFMHRVVNQTPDGFMTDHKNGVRHFNYAANLRTATTSQNSQNRPKSRGHYSSQFKGVSEHTDGRWQAYICINGEHIHLGSFGSEIEAMRAYNEAAEQYFGEFAKLNGTPPS